MALRGIDAGGRRGRTLLSIYRSGGSKWRHAAPPAGRRHHPPRHVHRHGLWLHRRWVLLRHDPHRRARHSLPEMRAVYDLVFKAQETAATHVHAGMSGVEADALAREVIVAAGHGDHFGHGLGHGVGLEIHEAPRLSPLAGDTPLPEGAVVSIEPVGIPAGRRRCTYRGLGIAPRGRSRQPDRIAKDDLLEGIRLQEALCVDRNWQPTTGRRNRV